jgi:hypothetical protein
MSVAVVVKHMILEQTMTQLLDSAQRGSQRPVCCVQHSETISTVYVCTLCERASCNNIAVHGFEAKMRSDHDCLLLTADSATALLLYYTISLLLHCKEYAVAALTVVLVLSVQCTHLDAVKGRHSSRQQLF